MKKIRRILIVTPDSKLGGAERNILLLARHMPRDRFRFSLATTFGTGDLVAGFRNLNLEAEEFRYHENPKRILDLFSYIKKVEPDLVHSFLLRGNWLARMISLRNRSIPWIASERGLDIKRSYGKSLVNRIALHRANLILAVSQPVKDLLVLRERIPERKIRVMNGGIAPADPPLPLPSSWNRLTQPRIVTVGHLRPEKNIQLSIEALAFARNQGLDASLTLLGEGPQRAFLETQAAKLGVAPHVLFAGNVLDARRLLSHFDLMLIPSKEEGFPNVMLEAWQAGLPVLSTDTPGAREISGPNSAACLVPEPDIPRQLVALISSSDRLAEWAGRGATRVGDFSIDRVVAQLTDIYDELLEPFPASD